MADPDPTAPPRTVQEDGVVGQVAASWGEAQLIGEMGRMMTLMIMMLRRWITLCFLRTCGGGGGYNRSTITSG